MLCPAGFEPKLVELSTLIEVGFAWYLTSLLLVRGPLGELYVLLIFVKLKKFSSSATIVPENKSL